MKRTLPAIAIAFALLMVMPAFGIAAGPPLMETGVVSGVDNSGWMTVSLGNTYTSMVVVASPNYDDASPPLVVRVRNAAGSGFELRVDRADGLASGVTPVDVHYVAIEEGAYTDAANGITMEARAVLSTVTDRRGSWVGQAQSYVNGYQNPVVLGQVMTYNDPDFSVFWTRGSSRSNPPTNANLYVGKQVAEDSDRTRANETLGYIVFEAGSGTIAGRDYVAGLGSDIVKGVGDDPPYSYSSGLASVPQVAIATSAAMDGNNGGWPILYGASPLSAGSLDLAIDEDQIRDSERRHGTEQIAFLILGTPVDLTPPVRSGGLPTGTLPAGATQATLGLATDEAATCRYDTQPGVAYAAMATTFGTTGGTGHSTLVTGLTDGSSNSYYVRCQDVAGNANTNDYLITFSVDTPSDLTAPVRSGGLPTGTLPAGTTQTTLSLATDENATCRYDTQPGVAYASMTTTFGTTGATDHSTLVTGLTDGSSNTYYVRCVDVAGNANTTDYLITFNVDTLSDLTPPVRSGGLPTGTLPAGTTQSTLSLGTDENATCRYDTQPGVAYAAMTTTIGTTGGTGHSTLVTGLTDGSSNTYYVRCQDVAGNPNLTDYPITFSVDTLADLTPPVRSGGLPTGTLPAGTNQATLSLATDEAATCRYDTQPGVVYAAMTTSFTTTGGTGHSTLVTSLTDGSSNTYYVRCQDGAGNPNLTDYLITFSVDTASDLTPPVRSGGLPTGTLPAGTTQTMLSLATDEAATCRYDTQPGVAYAAMTTTFGTTGGTGHSTLVTGLTDGSSNTYYVRCQDVAGNANTNDYPISFSVETPADLTPPVRSGGLPTGTLAAGTTQATLSLATDEAATCRYATVAGTAYTAMADTFATTGGTGHSTLVTGLTDGSSNTYYVRCQDGAGNANTNDYLITFGVEDPSSPYPPVWGGMLPPPPFGYFPTSVELNAGATTAYTLINGDSRTVKVLNTNLVFSDSDNSGTYTVWATAEIEVTGSGLTPVTAVIPAGYLQHGVVLNGVRVYVEMTQEFADGHQRISVCCDKDTSLILSDGSYSLTDYTQYRWPFLGTLWNQAGPYSYVWGLQSNGPVDVPEDVVHHNDGFDLLVPWRTPFRVWHGGIPSVDAFTGDSNNLRLQIDNPDDGRDGASDHIVLHLYEVYPGVEGSRVEAGDEIGTTNFGSFPHVHWDKEYLWPYFLSEWYMAYSTPEVRSYVDDWLLLGPYENSDAGTRLSTDYLGGEAVINPDAGDAAPGGLTWTEFDGIVPGVVNVGDAISGYPNTNWAWMQYNYPEGAAYLATYVYSPTSRSALLNVGGSDAVKVWLNSDLVLTNTDFVATDEFPAVADWPAVVDRDQVPVTLNAGWNRVLVKTAQGGPRYWKLSFRISDVAGNAISGLVYQTTKPGGADTIPPTRSDGQPTGTLGAGITQTTLSLTTNEAATCRYSANPGLAYAAMLDTFATTGSTAHSTLVTGLTDGSSNTFYVRCQDAVGNANGDDLLISFSVAAGDVAPPVRSNGLPIGNLPSGTTQTTLSLDTDEAATCRYAALPGTGYAAMPSAFATTGGTAHSTLVAGLTDGSTNTYYVRCQDGVGNANGTDYLIAFSVDNDVDLNPPTLSNGQPTGILPAGTTQAILSLSTDEAATCRYATIPGTDYAAMPNTFATTGSTAHASLVTGLVDGGSFSFYVRCLDGLGNANLGDFLIAFSVSAGDVTPPERSNGQPTGTLANGTTQATLSLSTNEAATCRYSVIAGTAYATMSNTFGTTGGTAHSTLVTGLVDGGSFAFYIRCLDGQGNANLDDLIITFSVASGGPTVVDLQVSASKDDAYHTLEGWPDYSDDDGVVTVGARGSNGPQVGGFRWAGLNIPANVTITSAYVELSQDGWGDTPTTVLALHNNGNPSPFSSGSSPAVRWNSRTTFEKPWTWPAQTPGEWIRTPSLAEGVQELVDRYGGIQSLVLLEDGSTAPPGQYHDWVSFDGSPPLAARLHVEYVSAADSTPPVRSNAQPAGVLPSGTTEISLGLTTDESANCRYDVVPGTPYAAMPNTFSTTGGTTHSTLVTGIGDGGTYTYYARCEDTSSNANSDDLAISFEVATPDGTPPLITNVAANPGAVTATITWTTDEPATSQVEYGLTNGLGSFSIVDPALNTGHSVTLTSLPIDTLHHFRVISGDVNGNSASSPTPPATFTTVNEVLGDTPYQLAFTVQPGDGIAGGTLPTIQVTVQDEFGNRVSSATKPITLAIADNPGGASLLGTTTMAPVDGIATFSNLAVSQSGSGYTLVASVAVDLLGSWEGGTHRYSDIWAEGNYAFVGTVYESKGVRVIDISDPTNPTPVYTWQPDGDSAEILDVKIGNGIAFFGSRFQGVYVVDVTDPLNPVQLAHIDPSIGGPAETHNLTLDGDYLYIADDVGPIVTVFDISDPANPALVQSISSPGGTRIHGVTAKDGRLYTSVQINGGVTNIFDISGLPGSVSVLGSFPSGSASHSSWPTDDGKYLVVAHEEAQGYLEFWDITDPSSPVSVSTLNPVALGFGGASVHDPVIIGNTLYATWANGYHIFDIANVANPVLVGSYLTHPSPNDVKDIGAWGAYAFFGPDKIVVSDWDNGVFVIDAAPLPTRSAAFDIGGASSGLITDLAVPQTPANNGDNVRSAEGSAPVAPAAMGDSLSDIVRSIAADVQLAPAQVTSFAAAIALMALFWRRLLSYKLNGRRSVTVGA